MTYKAHSNQIGFLQILMGHGVQNITFNCKNTAAYFNEAKNSYRNGLKLLSWNDAELTPRGPHRLRYDAIEDGCKVSL